ncbi:MAG: hypothetical protein IKR85_10165, partial [Clostridia bacterium]|nr:hypothetical protein [Clostridia bacterium]
DDGIPEPLDKMEQGGGGLPPNYANGAISQAPSAVVNEQYAKGNEVHHIVEQCQQQKSGFTKEQIQAESNKVKIPYDLHRKISGYYSSKSESCPSLRVRDYLAGKSFETQYEFGINILNEIRGIIHE